MGEEGTHARSQIFCGSSSSTSSSSSSASHASRTGGSAGLAFHALLVLCMRDRRHTMRGRARPHARSSFQRQFRTPWTAGRTAGTYGGGRGRECVPRVRGDRGCRRGCGRVRRHMCRGALEGVGGGYLLWGESRGGMSAEARTPAADARHGRRTKGAENCRVARGPPLPPSRLPTAPYHRIIQFCYTLHLPPLVRRKTLLTISC